MPQRQPSGEPVGPARAQSHKFKIGDACDGVAMDFAEPAKCYDAHANSVHRRLPYPAASAAKPSAIHSTLAERKWPQL
jgi:hypothetical protein